MADTPAGRTRTDAVLLSRPTRVYEGGKTRVSCTATLPGRSPQTIWMEITGEAVGDRNDAFVALALLPAMRLGLQVISEAPVSRSLLKRGLPGIQRVYTIWSRDQHTGGRFRTIEIQAPEVDDLPRGTGVGLFFSGGVDSSFSLLEAQAEIQDLIFIADFEGKHPPEDKSKATAAIANVAEAFGKELISVETNAREVFGEYVSFLYQHGSLLGAVALELQGRLSSIRVPSSCDVRIIAPFGSHPYLDPLWSTDGIEVIPDRIDVTRFEKVAAIADDRLLLSNMRACWLPLHNCGRCHKCVRLMVSLQALDRYERGLPVDRPPLTPYQVSRLPLARNQEYDHYYQEIEDYLADTARHPELLEALKVARSGWYYSPVGQFFRGDVRRRLIGKARRELAMRLPKSGVSPPGRDGRQPPKRQRG